MYYCCLFVLNFITYIADMTVIKCVIFYFIYIKHLSIIFLFLKIINILNMLFLYYPENESHTQ